jgi:hypothetical protein
LVLGCVARPLALVEIGAADALYQTLGFTLERFEQRLHDQAMARCQVELGSAAADDYRRGQAITIAQAISIALRQ